MHALLWIAFGIMTLSFVINFVLLTVGAFKDNLQGVTAVVTSGFVTAVLFFAALNWS